MRHLRVPQVSSDPDVNRTTNIVSVLTLFTGMIGHVSNSIKISSVLSCIGIKG